MDRGDFDFPPDPAAEGFDSTVDAINSLPLRVLSNTPIEQLPPTILPPEQQRPIGQVVLGNRQLRRPAKTTREKRGRPPINSESMPLSTSTMSEDTATTVASNNATLDTAGVAGSSSPIDGERGRGPTTLPKRARFDWNEEELREFYKFLSQYGTDFNAIAVMYPGRSRAEVKRLYHRELRRRREDVRAALAAREEIDLSTFRARLRRREEMRQGPTRHLDQEEEEALRLIEAGTLQLHENENENRDGEFEFNFDESDVIGNRVGKQEMEEDKVMDTSSHIKEEGNSMKECNKDDDNFTQLDDINNNNKSEAPMLNTPMDELVGLDEPLDDEFFL